MGVWILTDKLFNQMNGYWSWESMNAERGGSAAGWEL